MTSRITARGHVHELEDAFRVNNRKAIGQACVRPVTP